MFHPPGESNAAGLTHPNVSSTLVAMATNLKLDDRLIDEAVKVGGHKTKQAAVNAAISEYVSRRNRLRILELRGKIAFEPSWDYKKLRRRS